MLLSDRQRAAIVAAHGRVSWPTRDEQEAAAATYKAVFNKLMAGGPTHFGVLVANEPAFDSVVAECVSAANQAAVRALMEMDDRHHEVIDSIREAVRGAGDAVRDAERKRL